MIRVAPGNAANATGAGRFTSRDEQRMAWLVVGAAASAFGIAVLLAVRVAVGGPVAAVVENEGGRAVFGFVVDRLAGVVLVLVTGISLTVQGFAIRYLRGDRRAGRFFAGSATLTVATAAVATAATLTGLVAAWVLVSVSVCLLLAHRMDLPEARFGLRRTVRAFVVGDAALVAAAVLVVAKVGDLDLRSIATGVLDGERFLPVAWLAVPVAPVVATLVVVAALARSAQLPLPRWLSATLATPTPVSALLHAGVVNAGGLLLIRLSPLLDRAPAATHLALVAGLATAIVGSATMLVRPDVKGALAQSTVAQMGFMVVQCAVGAFGAAAFHLVAHAMYKAALFLGSGSAISDHGRRSHAPSPQSGRREAALRYSLAAVLSAAAITIVAIVVDPPVLHHRGGWLVAGFAWITGTHATSGWLGSGPSLGRQATTAAAALVVGATTYLGAVSGLDAFLAPALAEPGPGFASPWWVAAVAVVVGSIAAAFAAGRWGNLRDRLWVTAVGLAAPRPVCMVEPVGAAGDIR